MHPFWQGHLILFFQVGQGQIQSGERGLLTFSLSLSPGYPVSPAGPPQPGGLLQLVQQDDTPEPCCLFRPGAPHPDPGGLEGGRRRRRRRRRERRKGERIWPWWRYSKCSGFQTTYWGITLPAAAVARWDRRPYRAGDPRENICFLQTYSGGNNLINHKFHPLWYSIIVM